MKVSIRQFKALRPLVEPDLLGVGEATVATNCVVKSGALVPLKAPAPVLTLPGTRPITIYRFGQQLDSETQFWFQSHVDVDFVKGPVDNDTEERTYWTHGVGVGIRPRKTYAAISTATVPYPGASFSLGVPAPLAAPWAQVDGTATNSSDAAESRVYCYTMVTGWGEESAPSLPSVVVSLRPGQYITIGALTGNIPSGDYNYTAKRIYRSVVGTASTQFQFVAEVPLATDFTTDALSASQLGGVLVTKGWLPPPEALSGLTAMANGIMAGFTGNTVCFSVPYVPYAWPVAYQYSVDAPVVGIAAFDQSLFVGTSTGVYIATGSDPSSMTLEKLAVKQSCVAKRSVVPMLGGVVWASPDGLCYVGNSGFKLLTENLMNRGQWRFFQPQTFSAAEHEGRYVASYDNGTPGSIVLDLGDSPSLTTATVYYHGAYRDPKGDALFLAQPGNALTKFDAGSPMSITWRSGTIRAAQDRPWNCARVVADTYPVTFSFITDAGTFTQEVTSRFAFRLPPGRTSKFAVEVQGATTFREISVADSMQAMAEDG